MINIDHFLKLSRLEIKKQEKEKLEKDFFSILKFIRKLEEVEIKEIEPIKHSIALKNILREDKEEKFLKREKLLDLAPEKKDNYFKVKSVF